MAPFYVRTKTRGTTDSDACYLPDLLCRSPWPIQVSHTGFLTIPLNVQHASDSGPLLSIPSVWKSFPQLFAWLLPSLPWGLYSKAILSMWLSLTILYKTATTSTTSRHSLYSLTGLSFSTVLIEHILYSFYYLALHTLRPRTSYFVCLPLSLAPRTVPDILLNKSLFREWMIPAPKLVSSHSK